MTEAPPAPPTIQVPQLGELRLVGDGLWGTWARLHRTAALDHQWQMLEQTGALQAFRIAAGREEGFRASATGIPFGDSDVYKWVDAASRALATLGADEAPELEPRLTTVIDDIRAAQQPDGYLNTWVQSFAPSGRFRELVVEHELYCLGHLIEAGISYWEAVRRDALLEVGVRAADLLVQEFADAPAHRVDGHQEIELALVRLHRTTGTQAYLDLARQFVDRRGTGRHTAWRLAHGFGVFTGRELRRRRMEKAHAKAQPDWSSPVLRDDGHFKPNRELVWRFVRDAASGRYFQTDRPVREQVEPQGHAVRFGYQQVAMAMLARELGDDSLRAASEAAWHRMVDAHLFASGGVGAVPIVEAYGDPFDLDPDRAYLETCAAIAGVLWDRELGLLTGDPAPDDLLEWQLLNAVDVGMGVDGCAFAYDNPLRAGPEVARKPWFSVPCCPSNLSRTWASLPTLQLSRTDDELRVHQLFESEGTIGNVAVRIASGLPWDGRVVVHLDGEAGGDPLPRRLLVRIPSWAAHADVHAAGEAALRSLPDRPEARPTASGIDPRRARWAVLDLDLGAGAAEVSLDLHLGVWFARQDARVPLVGDRVAVARGPILYCLEGVDHPGLDHLALSDLELDPGSVVVGEEPAADLVAGARDLRASATDGTSLRFVPYFLWGNRGASGMTAFVRMAPS